MMLMMPIEHAVLSDLVCSVSTSFCRRDERDPVRSGSFNHGVSLL